MTEPEDRLSCDHDSLWALAVGVLPEDEAERQVEHAASCADCQERLTLIRADVEALGVHARSDRTPDQLAERVLERSRRVEARAKRLRWTAFSVLLLGMLAGSIYTANRLVEKALARRNLRRVEHAIQRIQNAKGSYPADAQELGRALRRAKDPGVRLDDQDRPLDHWGQPYRYRYPGEKVDGLFDLWSVGRNGVDEGGEPDDPTNWR